jgi:hypothetical protein
MGVCRVKRENAGKGYCYRKEENSGEKEEIGLETGRMVGIRGECRKKGENTGQKEKILGLGK